MPCDGKLLNTFDCTYKLYLCLQQKWKLISVIVKVFGNILADFMTVITFDRILTEKTLVSFLFSLKFLSLLKVKYKQDGKKEMSVSLYQQLAETSEMRLAKELTGLYSEVRSVLFK